MYNYTLEELKELREDTLEDYKSATERITRDEHQHDYIDKLKHDLEYIEEEIDRRIGERG